MRFINRRGVLQFPGTDVQMKIADLRTAPALARLTKCINFDHHSFHRETLSKFYGARLKTPNEITRRSYRHSRRIGRSGGKVKASCLFSRNVTVGRCTVSLKRTKRSGAETQFHEEGFQTRARDRETKCVVTNCVALIAPIIHR